jgi:hypothetical protein
VSANYLVAPSGRRWGLFRSGARKALKVFDTKPLALEHARMSAGRFGAAVFIFGPDGRISARERIARE